MGLFDNALSLLSDAQKAFDRFDLDSTIDSIMETGKNAFDNFNDFMKTVKDTVSDFKVIVPFNEKKEKFDISIEDGIISVKVKGKGTRRETNATIPSNCNVDELKHFVDKKNGNLVVVIPKNIAEDENLKKFKESVTTKVNSTATWLRDALKEKAASVAASTTAPNVRHKNAKKHAVKPKIVRGKDGRFVSSKVKKEA